MMRKIGLNNCEKNELKKCFHRYCDVKPKFFDFMVSHGMPLVIALCQEHADEWDDFTYEDSAKDFLEETKRKFKLKKEKNEK